MSRLYLSLFLAFVLAVTSIKCTDVPQYLALVADTTIASAQVQNFMVQQMTNLKKQFPDAATLIDQDMQLLTNSTPTLPWKNPADYHTTVFYLGYNATLLNSDYYKQFVPGKEYSLQSSTFVYIPGTIMCTPVFPQPQISIANKCPHITLKTNKWEAFLSNAVMESLFTNTGPLVSQYTSGFFMQADKTLVQRYQQMTINNQKVDVYIIKTNYNTDKNINLTGVAKAQDDNKKSNSVKLSTLISTLFIIVASLLI